MRARRVSPAEIGQGQFTPWPDRCLPKIGVDAWLRPRELSNTRLVAWQTWVRSCCFCMSWPRIVLGMWFHVEPVGKGDA